MMKRSIKPFTAMLLCLLLFLGAGCGKQPSKQESEKDLQALKAEMFAAAALPEMLFADSHSDAPERKLKTITDIAYDKVEDFFIAYAADGAAYEIAVITLKNNADADALADSLRGHIKKRAMQYRYYSPEETARAESARVAVKGSSAALVMCDDPAAVERVFLNR